MGAAGFGLVLVLMGLLALLISGPLSTLATRWHLFLEQEDKNRYRSKKRRGIRLLAKIWIALGGCLILIGSFVWILGLA